MERLLRPMKDPPPKQAPASALSGGQSRFRAAACVEHEFGNDFMMGGWCQNPEWSTRQP